MSLYDRILGLDDATLAPLDNKLPVDILASWVSEVQGGSRTQAQMNTYFSFDATEQAQLAELMGKVGTGVGRIQPLEFRSICQIAEYPQGPFDATHPLGVNNPYGRRAALKARLGVTQ